MVDKSIAAILKILQTVKKSNFFVKTNSKSLDKIGIEKVVEAVKCTRFFALDL